MDPPALSHVIKASKIIYHHGEELLVPEKAYRNLHWLNSQSAKLVRIQSEITEGEQRLRSAGVRNTILVFGSARSRGPVEHERELERARATLADPAATEEDRAAAKAAEIRLQRTAWMTEMYDRVQSLSMRLTEWSLSRVDATGRVPYTMATGGGPGLMEAANRGAAEVPGAMNIGVGISLPFEAGLNGYVTEELGFTCHYYFVRKVLMVAPCRAFIAAPGGYGTLDELFEVLTLLQSGKIEQPKHMPIVLFGKAFWERIVNWGALVELGVVSDHDVSRLFFTDSVDDAFAHITERLVEWEVERDAAAARGATSAAEAEGLLSPAAQAHLRFTRHVAARRAAGLPVDMDAAFRAAAATAAKAATPAAAAGATSAGGSDGAFGLSWSPGPLLAGGSTASAAAGGGAGAMPVAPAAAELTRAPSLQVETGGALPAADSASASLESPSSGGADGPPMLARMSSSGQRLGSPHALQRSVSHSGSGGAAATPAAALEAVTRVKPAGPIREESHE